jgi:hypothetical protein
MRWAMTVEPQANSNKQAWHELKRPKAPLSPEQEMVRAREISRLRRTHPQMSASRIAATASTIARYGSRRKWHSHLIHMKVARRYWRSKFLERQQLIETRARTQGSARYAYGNLDGI